MSTVQTLTTLTPRQINQIKELEKHNNQLGIFHKLDPTSYTCTDGNVRHILLYQSDNLAAYMLISLYNPYEIECTPLCFCPEDFALLLPYARKHTTSQLLVIFDHNDPLVSQLSTDFNLDFSEERMVFHAESFQPMPTALVMQDATHEHKAILAQLDSIAFGGQQPTPEKIACYSPSGTIIGLLNSQVIGKIRLDKGADFWGLYGFVIDPTFRGKGYGRQLLSNILQECQKEPQKELILEVESSNIIAKNLYSSIGFTLKCKFNYYRFSTK